MLVLDPADRLLLIRAHDPDYPELGEWWEVPGGGVDPGEDTVAAAVREVREETGVDVSPSDVVPGALWNVEMTYLWLGHRRWARQAIHLARPEVTPPVVAELHYTPDEGATFLGADWVPVANLPRLPRTFPDGVAQMLPRLLVGDAVDAGFAVWC